ncbi:uncharacterized protein LOC117341598 [Pecten maximus]|uniref:uncharacterized protein LOC117341598 n=1 Tax=Pecten maximus TaxID=6579 RepID=UPI0014582BC9|nr:uncharacterized protein LOC117341598 [Pecten maximus]
MVFQDGGLYSFTLNAVYDEGSCGHNSHISRGTVRLTVMKSGDFSSVVNFTDRFSSYMNRRWMVRAYLKFQTEFRPGEGLLINTNYIDCVVWNKTYLSVTKKTTKFLRTRTMKSYPLIDEYGQNYLRFNFTNSEFGIFGKGTSPAMVFQDGGLYSSTLNDVYDEGSCGQNSHISRGTVRLRVMKSGDFSSVDNFTERFSSYMNRRWMVRAYLKFQTEFRPGEGLLINTNYIDCVVWNKTYLSVTKVSSSSSSSSISILVVVVIVTFAQQVMTLPFQFAFFFSLKSL